MPNKDNINWISIILVSLQTAILAVGGWTLWTIHSHEARILTLEQWRGSERAYPPSIAREDFQRAEQEQELTSTVLEGHAARIRDLKIMCARMPNNNL